MAAEAMPEDLLEAVREMRVAGDDLVVNPLPYSLREQQPNLGAGSKEVREALKTLKRLKESKAIGEALEELTDKRKALQAETKALTALKESDATREAKLTAEIEAVVEALKALKKRRIAQLTAPKAESEAKAAAALHAAGISSAFGDNEMLLGDALSEDVERVTTQHLVMLQGRPELAAWTKCCLERMLNVVIVTNQLSKLSDDLLSEIFGQLRNVLEPGVAVAFGSASLGLRAQTLALRQQLKADHEAATTLCHTMGLDGCKELRKAEAVCWQFKYLCPADLGTLGTLGSVLPALVRLTIRRHHYRNKNKPADADGVQRLTAGLTAGAFLNVGFLAIARMHMGDRGALALAAALDRGAMPQLKSLSLNETAIGDAGLVALAPAGRRVPAMYSIILTHNPFGDEGFAALVPPHRPR